MVGRRGRRGRGVRGEGKDIVKQLSIFLPLPPSVSVSLPSPSLPPLPLMHTSTHRTYSIIKLRLSLPPWATQLAANAPSSECK